jgi:uroporphyrinogen decarboxylase
MKWFGQLLLLFPGRHLVWPYNGIATGELYTGFKDATMTINWNEIPPRRAEPDFNHLLAVLRRDLPHRPTLFEFFFNERLYDRLAPELAASPGDALTTYRKVYLSFYRLGYDFITVLLPGFSFAAGQVVRRPGRTVSLNEGAVLRNRRDFDAFPWPDPSAADYGLLERLAEELPPGMKMILYSPNGVLENVTDLVGYEALCVLIKEDPQLAEDIFAEVGSRLVAYYRRAAPFSGVGACISNDDWGFKTGTMFAPSDMRRFVFPWHRQIVEVVHAAGKPVILHSCGYLEKIMDDILALGFDGRHSYEDAIMPVETAYDRYHDRIAILGGIDLDFICRAAPQEIYQRSRAMLSRAAAHGGYALGTGNSVPDYVPDANFFALLRAVGEG